MSQTVHRSYFLNLLKLSTPLNMFFILTDSDRKYTLREKRVTYG